MADGESLNTQERWTPTGPFIVAEIEELGRKLVEQNETVEEIRREHAEAGRLLHKESHNELVGMMSQLMKRINDTGREAREVSGNTGSVAGGRSIAHDTRIGTSAGGVWEVITPGHLQGEATVGINHTVGLQGVCRKVLH